MPLMLRIPGAHFLRNLVERRNLLFQMVRRDFSQRFVGSAAGWVWGVIQPIVLLVSWYFAFRVCMRATLPADAPTQNYALFLFAGFLPWLLFQETVQRSATCLLEHQNLITKTVFPAEIVPVSIFLSSLVNHLIALALALASIWIFDGGGGFGVRLLLLPVYMFTLGLFAIGVAWIVSSLHVYLRDTAQVVAVGLTFWFWFTPIFITMEMIPAKWRFIFRWNPLALVVDAYRTRLLTSQPMRLRELAVILTWAVAVFVAGGFFFRHLKRGFADVL